MVLEDIRVVLVDGSGDDVSGITAALQRSIAPSFVFHRFDRPWTAVQFLKERNVDVVLLDFEILSRIDVNGLFRALSEAAEDVPIVLFSGQSDTDLTSVALDAADCVSREKFAASPESLLETIKAAVQKSKAARAIKGRETTAGEKPRA